MAHVGLIKPGALHFGFQPGAEYPLPAGFGLAAVITVIVALFGFSVLQLLNLTHPGDVVDQ